MALLTSEDTYVTYRYEIKDFYFTIDGTKTKLQGYTLKSFMVMNDYINNLFPIIQVKASMDYETYYNIIKNKDDVKVRIRIYKFYVKPANTDKSIKEMYIDKTFTLILDDEDEDLNEEARKKNNPDKHDPTDWLHEQANEVEFFLFRKDLVKASKKKINKILTDCTVTDALGLIFKKMNIKDMLMSPADNMEPYGELIIPPLKCTKAIQYIDSYYGIHNTGSIIYFGLDRSYFVKYTGKCLAWEKNELKATTIFVPKQGSQMSQNLCSVIRKKDNTRYYLVANPETIEFSNRAISTGLLTGSEVEIIDSETGVSDNSSNEGNANKTIIYNRGVSKFYKKIYKKQQTSLESVIECSFRDIDLDALKPNKKFNFVFEDGKLQKKYKGVYILVKCDIGLIRDNKELTAIANCTFYSDN